MTDEEEEKLRLVKGYNSSGCGIRLIKCWHIT